MYNSTRTIYNIVLQSNMILGIPYTPLKNTTLNEHFKIATEYELPENTYPTIQYLTLGVGGISSINDTTDILNTATHTADHIVPFKPIPFRLVNKNVDLTKEERQVYRLRKEIDVDGVTYVAYYLKKLDDNTKNGKIMRLTYDIDKDDKPALSIFNTDNIDILSPKALPNDNRIGDTTNYLIHVSTVSMTLTKMEFMYIKEAMDILGYEESRINEVGICSGYDMDINGDTESIVTQVMYHISIDYNIQNMINLEEDVTEVFDIGGVEPVISSY